MSQNEKTLGSICAGIGGFDIGFEAVGWRTTWQIELDDVNRAVLTDRFPHARQFKNLNDWRSFKLPRVDCITFGFPCQDISTMGNARKDRSRIGLAGERSGLFFAIMEIVRALQPAWLVAENVPNLTAINDGKDFETVIQTFAEFGYLGYARVLDAQYFGVPQKRRRLVMVAGLGRHPNAEFLADAGTVESLPVALSKEPFVKRSDGWVGYTLTAPDKHNSQQSRFNIRNELFVAEAHRWDSMLERAREISLSGVRKGLDATNVEEAYAAGNAFPPAMAKWIAGILNRS